MSLENQSGVQYFNVHMMLHIRRMCALVVAILISAHNIQAESSEDILKRQYDNQWFKDGTDFISDALKMKENNNRAKGVILFLGDGMGVSTVTAARIFGGQKKGIIGEKNVLSWEKFPYLGLSKTYNTDKQVADSAGTATAFLSGVKAASGVLSVDENVIEDNCQSSHGHSVLSILAMAERAGLSTGIVTTARVTHATPAAAYAHSANRDWEATAPENCTDIASQLLDFPHGNGPEVVLGGGRRNFLDTKMSDPEYPTKGGRRTDGRDLTKEWMAKSKDGDKHDFVWNESQFKKLDPTKVDHVLGLFERSHMKYFIDRKTDSGQEPTLSEMVDFAIKVLQKNPKGYFLLVEGGRIDHAHHDGNAYRALSETLQLDKAVELAVKETNIDETLIITTADHSHVFTIAGYPGLNNPIFGVVPGAKGEDGKGYTTLGYMNGPGGKVNGIRDDPTGTTDPDYLQQSLVPKDSESHGGEDVAIYAQGPRSHLLHGTVEQSVIFHLMDYALCLSDGKKKFCQSATRSSAAAQSQICIKTFVFSLLSVIILSAM